MTPLSEAVIELRLVVSRAEASAPPASASHDQFVDFRTATVADLMDAMDRFDTGLGTRLLLAMYPHANSQGAR